MGERQAYPKARVGITEPVNVHLDPVGLIADSAQPRARILHEEGNPAHRVRVEHNGNTILVHLSDEDGHGWIVLAVDRATRSWAVGTAPRQLDAARDAFGQLYAIEDAETG